MTFLQLMPYFAAGVPIKRKPWLGYWKYDQVNKSVHIFTKEGDVIALVDTEDILYTISNILTDDWEIATDNNCSIEVLQN